MAPGRLPWRAMILLIAFGLLVLLPGIQGTTRTLSSHEMLAAQPAREMLSDGHWIVPTVFGVFRTEKPPTAGWLIAAAMKLFHSDAEWVVRLPSMFSGILCSLIIALLASRWLGGLVGTLAGLMQLVTVWLQTQANLAEADMPLATAIALAMALFALGNVDHPAGTRDSRLIARLFMAATGVAFLFKGPVALLFIFGGCLLYLALTWQWRRLRWLADPIGLGILLTLLVAWPLAAYLSYPPIVQSWNREIFGYAGAQTFGTKPWWTYPANVPAYLLPWFPLIIPALLGGRRVLAAILTPAHRAENPDLRSKAAFALFLLAWFLPGMTILQFMKYRSIHYTYPLLAPWSIFMAAGLVVWLRWQYTRPLVPRWLTALATVFLSIAAILVIGLVLKPTLPAAIPAIIIVGALGLLAVLGLEQQRKLVPELVALFLTLGVVVALVDLRVIPQIPGNRARFEYASEISAQVPGGHPLYLVEFESDEIAWYLKPRLIRIDRVADFASKISVGEPVYVLTRTRGMDDLKAHYDLEILSTIKAPSGADLKDDQAKRPYLVKLLADRAGSSAPSTRPAKPAATELED